MCNKYAIILFIETTLHIFENIVLFQKYFIKGVLTGFRLCKRGSPLEADRGSLHRGRSGVIGDCVSVKTIGGFRLNFCTAKKDAGASFFCCVKFEIAS